MIERTKPKTPPAYINAAYQAAIATPSDIWGHVGQLRDLAIATEFGRIVEFGVRDGVSTRALLKGLHDRPSKPVRLDSYDVNPVPDVLADLAASAGVDWRFHQQDTISLQAGPCPVCDLLFIDTFHTGPQLRAELATHADRAIRWIAMHDTVTYGEVGENRDHGIGLLWAISQFLDEHRDWSVWRSFKHNNGLTVMQRRLPFVVGLCPTFRRPEQLSNAAACWQSQLYPADSRRLLILDDGQTWDRHEIAAGQIVVESAPTRFPSLPEKLNALARMAVRRFPQADLFVLWEDDDVYLPWHLLAHATAFQQHPTWSRPATVWSNYQRRMQPPRSERADGRFHGSWAIGRDHFEAVGGYPDTVDRNFDVQFGAAIGGAMMGDGGWWDNGGNSTYGFPPSYVYRWGAGAYNGSGFTSPSVNWYDAAGAIQCEPRPGQRIAPKFDAETLHLMAWLEQNGNWC